MKAVLMFVCAAGLSVGLLFMRCGPAGGRASFRDSLLLSTKNLNAYYDLHKPAHKFFLPYQLAEISGLVFRSPDTLLAIQDEKGIVYEFCLASEKITRAIKFSSPGDFEDLQLIGDSVFVLESKGDIRMFHLTDSAVARKDVIKIDTDLTIKNDAEGLGYDPRSHSLLIACKGTGEAKKNHVNGKAVYRLDLGSMKMDDQPFFNVTKKDLEKFFEHDKSRDYEADRFRFEPSAIAFNPADRLYYLMASVGKLIIVFDEKGLIQASYSIPAHLLAQPEGLCFSPEGDMYISSEGAGDKGYILKYPIIRK